jgi:N-acetyl sugar amidotransferase
MDTTDPDISFDHNGVCSHCHYYDSLAATKLLRGEEREHRLRKLVDQIKAAGSGRDYDCIIGVSGGVDSTYVAYVVKRLGLRPLAVHLDNGWDSELAVSNVERVLKTLGIDLFTHVIDWEEFKDLQLAFLKASTPDSEIPTDHAIMALLYQVAAKQRVKYILIGVNFATEAILPTKWSYGHADLKYIQGIQRQFGQKELKTYPCFSLAKLSYYMFVRRIQLVSILDYVDYDKKKAMDVLQRELGWVYYGGKHYESIYTKFFQAFILPAKFNIDKRKAHFSSLICSGQMSRDEALELMKCEIYPPADLAADRTYAIKKLGLTEQEFEQIMSLPARSFHAYPNGYGLAMTLRKVRRFLLGR